MPRPNRKPLNPDLPRPYAEIGARIREFRVGLGLDQSDYLSVYTTVVQVGRVETGLRAPTVEFLKLLREQGADLNWIITGDKP